MTWHGRVSAATRKGRSRSARSLLDLLPREGRRRPRGAPGSSRCAATAEHATLNYLLFGASKEARTGTKPMNGGNALVCWPRKTADHRYGPSSAEGPFSSPRRRFAPSGLWMMSLRVVGAQGPVVLIVEGQADWRRQLSRKQPRVMPLVSSTPTPSAMVCLLRGWACRWVTAPGCYPGGMGDRPLRVRIPPHPPRVNGASDGRCHIG